MTVKNINRKEQFKSRDGEREYETKEFRYKIVSASMYFDRENMFKTFVPGTLYNLKYLMNKFNDFSLEIGEYFTLSKIPESMQIQFESMIKKVRDNAEGQDYIYFDEILSEINRIK